MAKISFLLAAVALMITFEEGFALKCWRCSSDSTNAAFCRDPFDPSILTEQQRRWSYVDCTFPPNQINPYQTTQTRPVCKKMTQKSYDKYIVSRSCYWEDINTPPDTCQRATTPAFIQTEFCETCSTDGCNGASTQALSAFLFLGVSALVYKTLKW